PNERSQDMTTTPPSQTAGIAVGKGSTHHLTLDWRPLCGATGTLGLKAGSKDVADLERRYLICERCQRTTAYASVREQLLQPAGSHRPTRPRLSGGWSRPATPRTSRMTRRPSGVSGSAVNCRRCPPTECETAPAPRRRPRGVAVTR